MKKIDKVIMGLDEVKKQEVLAQIHSVKVNSFLAILAVVGSCISFIVIQQSKIKSLFERNPTILVSSREAYITRAAQVQVSDINGKIKLNVSLANFTKKLDIDTGSFTIKLFLNDSVLWRDNIVLQKNDDLYINLPKLVSGNIKVMLTNGTPNPRPGQQIDIDINTTGNGFLWIYERAGTIKLLFPKQQDIVDGNRNSINADKAFQFPSGIGLVAGDNPGKEEYLFLVTSVNDEKYSASVLKLFYKTDVEKGEIRNLEKNWGIETLKVTVTN